MYLVFNDGCVYSKYRNIFLSPFVSSGYLTVSLSLGPGKCLTIRIHRLVASHFVHNENKEKFNIVDHIDGDKLNNHYFNLRWTDLKGNAKNVNHAHHNSPVIQYDECGQFIAEYNSLIEASRKTGIGARMIIFSCNDTYKTHDERGNIFHWKYKEKHVKIDKPDDSEQISGFPNYFVTKNGKIYSTFKSNFLKTHLSEDGYEIAFLKYKKTKKKFSVHTLVARAFLPEPRDKNMQVNHKDVNRSNNNVSNLEYVTASENCIHKVKHNPKLRRCVIMIDPITSIVLKRFDSISEAARETGLHFSTIGNNIRGLTKTAGGFQWQDEGEEVHKIAWKQKRQVEKSDLNGNVIETYDTITGALKSVEGKTTTFRRYIGKGKPYKGYMWKIL